MSHAVPQFGDQGSPKLREALLNEIVGSSIVAMRCLTKRSGSRDPCGVSGRHSAKYRVLRKLIKKVECDLDGFRLKNLLTPLGQAVYAAPRRLYQAGRFQVRLCPRDAISELGLLPTRQSHGDLFRGQAKVGCHRID
jgi:hypothetical protein